MNDGCFQKQEREARSGKPEEWERGVFGDLKAVLWGMGSSVALLIGVFVLCGTIMAGKVWGAAALGESRACTTSNGAGSKRVAADSLPGALQGMLSETLGANDPRYRVTRSGGGYRAVNSPNRLIATIGPDGFRVRSGSNVWGLRLTAWGRDHRLKRVAAARRAVSGSNRVAIDRGGITEWWVNGPLGIEQGWTVAGRPHAGPPRGRLALELRQAGNLRARILLHGRALGISNSTGREVLRYAGLTAYDKTGRQLPARFEATAKDVRVVIDDTGAAYPVRIDPWVQAAKLTASDGASMNWMGVSVAVSQDGSVVVAGASGATVGNNASQGAVYVFNEPASGWANGTQAARLTASDGAANNELGYSVAVSSDGATVVAGAPYATAGSNPAQGAVYVFTQPASGWASETQTARLTASNGASGDCLGESVAVGSDGATIVAGAYEASQPAGSKSAQGAVYVFTQPGSGWADGTQAARLTASDGAPSDCLGFSVAVSSDGTTVAGGAYGASEPAGSNSAQGAVYVFTQPASGWADVTQTAKLTASDGAACNYLGYSVAVSPDGKTIVTGAPYASVGSDFAQGAVYVFAQQASGWTDGTQTARLTQSDGASGDTFGASVAVSLHGETVVAGAQYAKVGINYVQGAVYVFGRPASGWADGTETAKLTASDGQASDYLGGGVALSGDGATVFAGTPGSTVGNNYAQGAVYEFQAGLSMLNGACGNSNGGLFSSTPTSNLCSSGTVSTVTTGTGFCNWTCAGLNGGTNAGCSATLVVQGACGSSNGAAFRSAPTSNLCGSGTATSLTTAAGVWNWSCTGLNGGTNASCSANIIVDGACGSSNGGSFNSAPSTNLCSGGTVSPVTSTTGACSWTCTGLNGGTNANCSANLIVNGACGSSNGGSYNSPPSTNLCTSGTTSSVTSTTGACSWTCTGLNGGTNANCSANLIVNGACGSSSGGSYHSAPSTNLCTSGTTSPVTTTTGACSWSCTGLNGGTNANCSANLIVDGACGSSSGGSFSSAPTTSLCSGGTASSVAAGSGTWGWSCAGLNGGATVNCSANLIVNGACGSSSGGSYSSAPTTNLCSGGTASPVTTATGSCSWSCTGLNGGANASCSADLIVDGACGSSSGGSYSSAPTTNLCSGGTASSVTAGSGTWGWTCSGLNGGAKASCSATDPGDPLAGAADYGNGWKYFSWFGYFNTSSSPWIFHVTLGWLYPFGTSTDSLWFWDPRMNTFWWTSAAAYPWVYRASDRAWLYYDVQSSNPRRFYNTNTGAWETD